MGDRRFTAAVCNPAGKLGRAEAKLRHSVGVNYFGDAVHMMSQSKGKNASFLCKRAFVACLSQCGSHPRKKA
jgi:hypothetical protein